MGAGEVFNNKHSHSAGALSYAEVESRDYLTLAG